MKPRRPSDSEYPDIYKLLDRAFAPSIAESKLVRDLKARRKITLDLVMEHQARIAAYVCYSAALDSTKAVIGCHLAPLAVLPEKQRQRLGRQVTLASLRLLPEDLPVYVLGDPRYYEQIGFRKDKTQTCSFDPEGKQFMVLFDGRLPPRDVLYEEEFYELAGEQKAG